MEWLTQKIVKQGARYVSPVALEEMLAMSRVARLVSKPYTCSIKISRAVAPITK